MKKLGLFKNTLRVYNQRSMGGYNGDPKCKYVGRPGVWGNPYPLETHGRIGCIFLFIGLLVNGTPLYQLQEKVKPLAGHNLLCWCAPEACHADVWLYLANLKVPLPHWLVPAIQEAQDDPNRYPWVDDQLPGKLESLRDLIWQEP